MCGFGDAMPKTNIYIRDDRNPHKMNGRCVLLDRHPFVVDYMHYENGLSIHMDLTTEEQRFNFYAIYKKMPCGEASISIDDFQRVAAIREIGYNYSIYNAKDRNRAKKEDYKLFERGKICLRIPYPECRRFV
jgi:hypothetical protein